MTNDNHPFLHCLPPEARIASELEYFTARLLGQPWVHDWLSSPLEPDAEAIEWIQGRPGVVQELMILFPPSCLVRSVPSERLHCPAPDTLGIVTSYFETDTICVRQSPDSPIRAECHIDWLEVVAYRQPCTPEWVRNLLQN